MALVLGALAVAACRQDMHDQPVYEALEPSPFFPDGRASRPPVAGNGHGQRELPTREVQHLCR